MDYVLLVFAGAIALASVFLSPKAESEGAFYQGLSASGRQPGLPTLTFSQVTTWIFARSLMNAAILYFTEATGYSHLLGDAHKYTRLLYLTVGTLTLSCFGFGLGGKTSPRPAPQSRPA